MNISIIGGRVIDPASNTDATLNLHIKDETLIAIGDAPSDFSADQTIDATGKIVCPGLNKQITYNVILNILNVPCGCY